MKRNTTGRVAAHSTAPILMFLFLASLFLFCLQGVPGSGDPEAMFLVARGMASSEGIAPDATRGVQLVKGRDGRYYSKFGLGQSLIEVPGVWLAGQITPTGTAPRHKYLISFLLAVAVVPLVTAFSALIFYLIVRELAGSVTVAAGMSLLYALCTLAWTYSKSGFSEPLQTALLLGTIYSAMRSTRAPSRRTALSWAASAGFCAGFLLATKAVMIVTFPFIIAYLLFNRHAQNASSGTVEKTAAPSAARAICFLLPLFAWSAVALYYNYARFGGALDFGYNEGNDASFGFTTPLLSGLYGLLFSPGKSIFLYSPIVLAGIACSRAFHRRNASESLLVWGLSITLILVYSKWWAWHGDYSWGPRFLLPCIPLALLPLCSALNDFRSWRFPAKAALVLLAAASFAVQLPGVAVSYHKYIRLTMNQVRPNPFFMAGQRQLRDGQLVSHFIPEFSPITGQTWVLKHTLLVSLGMESDPNTAMKKDFPWRSLTCVDASTTTERNFPCRGLGCCATSPPNPEYALGFDFWHVYLPGNDYIPESKSYAHAARYVLAASCIIFLIMLLFSLKSTNREG